ncbi:MAG: hypothetical protein GKS06_13755 [Acidobacteria bacterium]|nr:hypothetical protein [Acidobacteriota bacterium]
MTDIKRKSAPRDKRPFNRRDLLRQAGFLGAGAVGLGLAGCKQRPDDELVDPTSPPQVLQEGGTLSVAISGLLGGAVVGGATMNVLGVGTTTVDSEGQLSVRFQRNGTYEVEFRAAKHFARSGRVSIFGNSTLVVTMMESDAGVSQGFINEYARGAGSGKGIVVEPRTPGYTNRWTQPPTYRIYRRVPDSSKTVVPDSRIDAMRSSILSIFPALTASTVGFPTVVVRDSLPPSLGDTRSGHITVVQTDSVTEESEHTGLVSDPFAISRGRISCALESTIELFNKMVGHSTGAYGTSSGRSSIMSGGGRSAPSDRDVQAATFLYARAPGNSAPDRDQNDALLS